MRAPSAGPELRSEAVDAVLEFGGGYGVLCVSGVAEGGAQVGEGGREGHGVER